MAAGGFKTFTTGEVLTAADTNNFLMQGVLVFDDAAARDAAITAPVEGQVVYLKDTNAVLSYDGTSYVGVGGSSPLTTKGDLYTFSTVDARLGVGANDTVLTADSAEATGLKWAAPAGGGANWTLFNAGGTALTGATTITISSITAADKIMILVKNGSAANSGSTINLRLNGDTGSNYYNFGTQLEIGSTYSTDIASIVGSGGDANNTLRFATMGSNAASQFAGYVSLTGCNASGKKMFQTVGAANNGGGNNFVHRIIGGYYDSASAISSVSIISSSGNFDAGTIFIYTSN